MDIREINQEIQNHVGRLEHTVQNLKGGSLLDLPQRLDAVDQVLMEFSTWIYENRQHFYK